MSRTAMLADWDVARIIETDRHRCMAGVAFKPLGTAWTEPVEVSIARKRAAGIKMDPNQSLSAALRAAGEVGEHTRELSGGRRVVRRR
jgi:hypothetical protein